ncbi:uncharacterized protein LOC131023623 [Salvia miltiorrhiza]|uniref:uncharacterized protein LOC131023623 n=1 Tax=Salvia miltiorrhiza TaxID=226208 RepID=UPI0025AC6682|nr:uncharacterized protein LOC131023623 [Salvia miltiorrhiza]
MNAISWNCRGLGQPLAVPVLSELVRVHKPQFLFLCETISSRARMEEFRVRLKFEGCFVVDCVGRSGGLCMFWKSSAICKLIGYSNNHIDMHVEDDRGVWRLTGFYGFPERNRRRDSWQLLRRLAGINPHPWIIMGDFNDLLDPGDKQGRVDHPNWLFTGFRSAILDCGLSDIPLRGYQFTWSRGLGTTNFVEERLDRGMASSSWKSLFPDALLIPLTVPMSDHVPLLLKCLNMAPPMAMRSFRFENKWCLEPDFPNVVRDCWTNLHGVNIMERLTAVSNSISSWAYHLRRNKEQDKVKLHAIISTFQGRSDLVSVRKFKAAREELGRMLLSEDAHWKQRPKQYWLKDGDLNTKFFHAMATTRKKKNAISKLQRTDGSWTTDIADIKIMAYDYFVQLFDVPHGANDFHQVLDRLSPCIDGEKNAELTRDFHIDEFRAALFQMHPDKSPGPDGLNPKFFQSSWKVLGEDVFESCSSWLRDGSFPAGLNHTSIALIPKIDTPASMKDLRPIALCNVLYKIISKVLCNRLKGVLPTLIDRAQSVFVEGRLIQDNILIAFEAIHTMKRKTRGKYGSFAFKIDISKAYDRVNWSYLDAVLRRLGFCDKWRDWMRLCVQTVSYDVLVNNCVVGPITPGRGLRQGDPLSPYLFILCAEGLSAMVKHETARGSLHGVQLGRGGPSIEYLMFADDCLFFCRAAANECEILKRVLRDYEEASGQAINLQKSGIFFSSNVSEQVRTEVSAIMGVSLPLNTGRYLGLPSLVGRKKREIFNYLCDHLWNKIQGLTDDLEKMLNSFWWSNKSASVKGINWLKWERLCVDKKLGGLGFRSLQLLNVAMLGKTCWRLIDEPEALVCQVLRAKYFPNGDFLSAKVGHSPSYTWRSIMSAQDLVRRGTRWRIGQGTRIRLFHDPWLRSKVSFRPSMEVCPPEFADIRVNEVLLPGTNQWNVEILQELVNANDFHDIISTPIFPNMGDDKLIWHSTKNGRYSVKSAYQLASSLTLDGMHNVDGQWGNLWKLDVPPKVKHFLWRAVRNNLPSKEKLLSRGVAAGGDCPICASGYENMWHLFLFCQFATNCWQISGLRAIMDPIIEGSESFEEVVFKIVSHSEGEFKVKAVMLMWQIWRDRNGVVWKNDNPIPTRSILGAAQAWSDWKLARAPVISRNSSSVSAAIDRLLGIGIVIRNHLGEFVLGKTIILPGCRSVEEGELVGIKEALSWIKGLGYEKGVIESDCKRACDVINSIERNISEVGVIASLCRSELVLMPGFHVVHVKRDLNAIAHSLAKVSRDFSSHHVWTEPPISVVGHLHLPCSCDQ